jgi:hypothetical protein
VAKVKSAIAVAVLSETLRSVKGYAEREESARVYLQSWVIPSLEQTIEHLKGNLGARELAYQQHFRWRGEGGGWSAK